MTRPHARLLAGLLAAVIAGCSSSTDPGPCEAGPYFTELPVDGAAINWFVILGQFNPPGDIVPRPQTGLQLKSNALTPLRAVGDLEITLVESTRWIASSEREGHVIQPPESWAFAGAAVRLMS